MGRWGGPDEASVLPLRVDVIQRVRHRLIGDVVRTGLPRIAPYRPTLAVSGSTVQRAIAKPSRFSPQLPLALPRAVDAEAAKTR